MLSKTAQGSTASRSQATAPTAGGGQSGVDVTQLQNLLATLQNSQSVSNVTCTFGYEVHWTAAEPAYVLQ